MVSPIPKICRGVPTFKKESHDLRGICHGLATTCHSQFEVASYTHHKVGVGPEIYKREVCIVIFLNK